MTTSFLPPPAESEGGQPPFIPPSRGPDLPASQGSGPARRVLERRPTLPSTRAVVGALLVLVAALAAYTGATRGAGTPSTGYVVAAESVAPGQVLHAADLEVVPIELPAATASGAFTDPTQLDGSVALGPLDPGDLVTRAAVAPASGLDTPSHEVSFAVERAQALDGRLQIGERVGVLATYGTGDAAVTVPVVDDATIVQLSGGDDDALGASGALTVTLALHHGDDAVAVTHAAQVGVLTLTRTAGTDGDTTAPTGAFHTPTADDRLADRTAAGTGGLQESPPG